MSRVHAPREVDSAAGSDPAPDTTVRRATPADRPAVEELLRRAHLPLDGLDGTRLLVAEARGDLVGVGGLETHGGEGIFRSLAVAEGARGQGLGGRLLERVVEEARASGLRRLWLLTTTAEGYFPRHGFVRAGREDAPTAIRESVEFRDACPASATCMTLELEPA